MDFIPRHPQPFSLQQAALLETPILSEEITRLQNSLQHLKRTQKELEEHLATSTPPDPDFVQAIAENEDVIGSQEERILMLKLALAHKGASANSSHYDLTPSLTTPDLESSTDNRTAVRSSREGAADASNRVLPDDLDDEDGVHL